jgi:hypothetical protein
MYTAPFERELVVERATVRKARQPVGRRLGCDSPEIAERVQDRPRKQERDQYEQREGAYGGVEHALLVGMNARVDRLLGPERKEADPEGVGDA